MTAEIAARNTGRLGTLAREGVELPLDDCSGFAHYDRAVRRVSSRAKPRSSELLRARRSFTPMLAG
jgi:hypothetical protein